MKSHCLEPEPWPKALFILIWLVVVGGCGIPRDCKASELSGECELGVIASQVPSEPVWSNSAAEQQIQLLTCKYNCVSCMQGKFPIGTFMLVGRWSLWLRLVCVTDLGQCFCRIEELIGMAWKYCTGFLW